MKKIKTNLPRDVFILLTFKIESCNEKRQFQRLDFFCKACKRNHSDFFNVFLIGPS